MLHDPFPEAFLAAGITSEVAWIHLHLLTEVAQEAGPHPRGVWRGGVQAAMVQQWQSAVVLGQDEQPQGLAVHQGMPAPASLATASQQCAGGCVCVRAGGGFGYVAQHRQE